MNSTGNLLLEQIHILRKDAGPKTDPNTDLDGITTLKISQAITVLPCLTSTPKDAADR